MLTFYIFSTLETYFVYTDKRPQKGPKLEIFFVIEEREQPRRFRKQMPESWWDSKATLDQVTHTKHPNEALEKILRMWHLSNWEAEQKTNKPKNSVRHSTNKRHSETKPWRGLLCKHLLKHLGNWNQIPPSISIYWKSLIVPFFGSQGPVYICYIF